MTRNQLKKEIDIQFLKSEKNLLTLMIFFFFMSLSSFGEDGKLLLTKNSAISEQQQRTITGVVKDNNGNALPGVTIQVKGTTLGSLTGADGSFSVAVPSTADFLVFSFIGMGTQEVSLEGETTLNVVMKEQSIGLEEVVVVGYGEQSRRHLTGAIESISAEQFVIQKPQSVTDMLRSNAPGLMVGASTTAKGGASLEIRGTNSLRTSTNPLIVLDGVIYMGDLSDINPNDIASMDVMKDAASAAIYGARSANGVIQITTKRGKEFKKPTINFNSSLGVAQPTGYAEVRSAGEFINWRSDLMKSLNWHNPATMNKLYLYDNPENLPEGVTLDQWKNGLSGDPQEIWLGRLGLRPLEIANYKAGRSIDWANVVYQKAIRQDYNISLSGSSNAVSYFISLGYNNNEGVIVGDAFKTIRNRFNIDADVTKWLKVGINSQFARRDESNVNSATNIQTISPYGSMYEDDGDRLRLSPVDDIVSTRNPVYDRSFTDRLNDITTLNSTLFTFIKLPLGITYRMNYTPNFKMVRWFNHMSSQHQEWGLFGGQVERQHTEEFNWQLDNIIKWEKQLNDHRFDATILINAEKVQGWYDQLLVQKFAPSDVLGYHNVSSGSPETRSMNSEDTYSTRDALMARLNYSFKDRYMISGALRRDGYSAFGMSNPRAYFPTTALGWVFSEESFLKNDFLTYGKLRLSWGENGNSAIGIYDALSPMGVSQYLYYSQTSGAPYEVNRMFVSRMANHNLKWERTRQLNLGVDFTITNGLFDGSIDVYKSQTLDLLVDRSLPLINAYASVTDNLGEIQNMGVELLLNARVMKKSMIEWNSHLSFTYNKNEIISLYGNMIDVKDDAGNVIGTREADDITNRWFIGHAIDELWYPIVLGVWQLGEEEDAAVFGQYPGDFKLKDVTGDGKITQSDYEFQGNSVPPVIWNLKNDLVIYKDIELSFTINSQMGYKGSFNMAKNSDGFPERQNSFKTDYWTPENPTNKYSRLYALTGGASFDVYRRRDFVRLDQVSIGYNVPQKYLDKLKIKNMKLYFNVQNVAYFAPGWELTDPQTRGLYPRIFTSGINLTL